MVETTGNTPTTVERPADPQELKHYLSGLFSNPEGPTWLRSGFETQQEVLLAADNMSRHLATISTNEWSDLEETFDKSPDLFFKSSRLFHLAKLQEKRQIEDQTGVTQPKVMSEKSIETELRRTFRGLMYRKMLLKSFINSVLGQASMYRQLDATSSLEPSITEELERETISRRGSIIGALNRNRGKMGWWPHPIGVNESTSRQRELVSNLARQTHPEKAEVFQEVHETKQSLEDLHRFPDNPLAVIDKAVVTACRNTQLSEGQVYHWRKDLVNDWQELSHSRPDSFQLHLPNSQEHTLRSDKSNLFKVVLLRELGFLGETAFLDDLTDGNINIVSMDGDDYYRINPQLIKGVTAYIQKDGFKKNRHNTWEHDPEIILDFSPEAIKASQLRSLDLHAIKREGILDDKRDQEAVQFNRSLAILAYPDNPDDMIRVFSRLSDEGGNNPDNLGDFEDLTLVALATQLSQAIKDNDPTTQAQLTKNFHKLAALHIDAIDHARQVLTQDHRPLKDGKSIPLNQRNNLTPEQRRLLIPLANEVRRSNGELGIDLPLQRYSSEALAKIAKDIQQRITAAQNENHPYKQYLYEAGLEIDPKVVQRKQELANLVYPENPQRMLAIFDRWDNDKEQYNETFITISNHESLTMAALADKLTWPVVKENREEADRVTQQLITLASTGINTIHELQEGIVVYDYGKLKQLKDGRTIPINKRGKLSEREKQLLTPLADKLAKESEELGIPPLERFSSRSLSVIVRKIENTLENAEEEMEYHLYLGE